MRSEGFPAAAENIEKTDIPEMSEEASFAAISDSLERLGFSLSVEEYQRLSDEKMQSFLRRRLLVERFAQAYADIDASILRAHQVDGVNGLYDFLFTPNPSDEDGGLTKRGVLTHAPGAGKSIFAAFVSSMFGVNKPPEEGQSPVRVLYLTHDRKGLGQTMGKDEVLRGFAKVLPDIPTAMVQKGQPFEGHSIVGMTYAALRQWVERDPTVFDSFDVTFADECQEALGPRTREAIEHIMKNKINIALTGSPELGDERTVYELWPETIHNISFREGVEERGILNSFILYRFKTGEGLKSVIRRGEYLPDAYKHLAKNEVLTAQTRQLALLLAGHNIKTTVFAFRGGGSKHAIDLAALIDGQTVFDRATQLPRPARARAVGSFQSDAKNVEVFSAFDRGELDILTTTQMGETAWDPAQLNAILLVCPTRSLRAIIQRLGRGARISDSPTVVIHFDYDDDQQKSPYDVFDEPDAQGVLIAPPDVEIEVRERFRSGQFVGDRRTPDNAPLVGLNSEEEAALDKFAVFDSLFDFMGRAEVRSVRRTALYRSSRDLRRQNFVPLSSVAKNYDIDQIVLEGLLRRNRIKVVSFDEDTQRVSYGPEEAVVDFIENEVARRDTFNAAQLIAKLGMSRKWVYGRVANEAGELCYARDTLEKKKSVHYPLDVYVRLQQERDETSQEIQDDEISVVELCGKYGTDFSRTVEWFERRGVPQIKRKRSGKTAGSSRSGLVCFPKKYEAQFAWHWTAETLPDDRQHLPLSLVFERSSKMSKMGHAQRKEILDELHIKPRRYRTATHFNYYVTRQEQLAMNALANGQAIRPDTALSPRTSAIYIANQRDAELFIEHVRANNLEMPENILERSTSPSVSSSSASTTAKQETATAEKGPVHEDPAKPPTELPIHDWDEDEGMRTTIYVARQLKGYSIGSGLVLSKAQEFGLTIHRRRKGGIVYDCLSIEDCNTFIERYSATVKLTSLAQVAAMLQIPESFVEDVAINLVAGRESIVLESGEHEAAVLRKAYETTKRLDHTSLQAVVEQIVGALRSLHVRRPQDGSVIDEQTLERVRARIIMRQEPLLRELIHVAGSWDVERARKQ